MSNYIEAEFEILEQKPIEAVFEVQAVVSADGIVEDLNNEINRAKQAENQLQGQINTITADIDDISEELTTKADKSNTYTKAQVDSKIASIEIDAYTKSETNNLITTKILNHNQDETAHPYIQNLVTLEVTDRENAVNDLQEQIDGIVAGSDVKDIVGTYAELLQYDTSTLGDNDIIEVLKDETQENAISYYRWVALTNSFSFVGAFGPYTTPSEVAENYVPKTRQVNGKPLTTDIELTASDVGALPSSTIIPTVNNGKLTVNINDELGAEFTANQSTDIALNIDVPTQTSELINDSGFITSDYHDSTKQDLLPTGTAGQVLKKTSDGVEWSNEATSSVFRGLYNTWNDVPTTATYKADAFGSTTPTYGDIIVVKDASGYNAPLTISLDVLYGPTQYKAIATYGNKTEEKTLEYDTDYFFGDNNELKVRMVVDTSFGGNCKIEVYCNINYIHYNDYKHYSGSKMTTIYDVKNKDLTSHNEYVVEYGNSQPLQAGLEGTWLFIYEGVWNTDNKEGWKNSYPLGSGSGGGGTWGSITGTLSDQTDLQTALNGKQPTGNYALKSELPTVPTNISSFTNDSGYVTSDYHDSTKQDKATYDALREELVL